MWPSTRPGSKNRQLSVLRLILRAVMRDVSVVGLRPRNSAAPLGPKTLPLVCFKA